MVTHFSMKNMRRKKRYFGKNFRRTFKENYCCLEPLVNTHVLVNSLENLQLHLWFSAAATRKKEWFFWILHYLTLVLPLKFPKRHSEFLSEFKRKYSGQQRWPWPEWKWMLSTLMNKELLWNAIQTLPYPVVTGC